MHQLLSTEANGQNIGSAIGKIEMKQSIQISEVISLSSFEIVKSLKMHTLVYAILIMIETGYLMFSPAQGLVNSDISLTTEFLNLIGGSGVELITIISTALYFLQLVFIFYRGRELKKMQTSGHERSSINSMQALGNHNTSENKSRNGAITEFLVKGSGVFLIVNITLLDRLMFRIYAEHLYCNKEYELELGCKSQIREVGSYIAIFGFIFLLLVSLYADLFVTKMFPDEKVPWAGWNDRAPFLRTLYKIFQTVSKELIGDSYEDIMNFALLVIAIYLLYDRYIKPSLYNKTISVIFIFLESQILVFTLASCLQGVSGMSFTESGLLFIVACGCIVAVLIYFAIDKRETDIKSMNTDIKNFKNLFQIELYVVSMLHELEKLVSNEEYGQEKHVHAVISRHMEDCKNDNCPCKNYEPEYDKKFTTVGSKRLTVNLSMGSIGMGTAQSLQDMKRLPYKITYKTKVEIFKQEFEIRVDQFLEAYPKGFGIKLLKSFFNHKYCDSSYKALFVQLENSATCKSFKGKIFIYHLKTQIQDEMKKSLESPLSIDINQLLIFEKYKLDFEKHMENLSYNCQQFWTDLTKEDYDVEKTLKTAYDVSEKIIDIKSIFQTMISINPLCIDTSSTYALAYRYILRDEATFTELVTRIQQIKNSSKLEQQRELGIRFFDSDIYSLLMVTGDIKELGRIRQANSSSRFVFGYDPRDLIGSKINKLMPQPFANIHDKFLSIFLTKGKSNFLERNQPLPVITKDGFLQMTLFYVKPMVSLHFGLIFSTFAKILNKYRIADDSHENVKMSKLSIVLTDGDGYIYGMNEQCSRLMGMPPPNAKQQFSMNDNQPFNIQQICKQVMQQEYEFELIKGVAMTVDTSFLNRERQYRREFPDIACKIGRYQADVGVHKFSYRDMRAEINIFVIKIDEKDPIQGRIGVNFNDSLKSKSVEDELTYSEFSITTANSSVVSSQVATSKFKTFKLKIQNMTKPSHVVRFQRISFLTFFLLIGIAAGNFAINFIQNLSFMKNLEVLENLQILIEQVPEASHSTRQILLIANGLVKTSEDEIIKDYHPSKYDFYSSILRESSQSFEEIQKKMKTDLKDKVSFDQHTIQINDAQTDTTIKRLGQSMQTALNIFSSKILKLSTFNQTRFINVTVPHISFQWSQMSHSQRMMSGITELQQDTYYVIQNGFGAIVQGLKNIQHSTENEIFESSLEAAVIAIALAAVSIFLVIVLLPTSLPTLTHIEKVSQLTLMSLNRLPEVFCTNETKACVELIMFLNEQKDGEKSTHQMIKKHEHRKQNRQILKLPKNSKPINGSDGASSFESDGEESDYDRSSMIKSQKKSKFASDSASTGSRGSGSASVTSSKITSLSKVRAAQNQYEAQQLSQIQRVKRNQGGGIDLELAHAKTSELLDEDQEENNEQLSEEEKIQKEREKTRKAAINKTFRRKKIWKFIYLIITALVIAIYFAITSFYLNLVHEYERMYSDNYELIGSRIQCYTNAVTYVIDSLARNELMNDTQSDNLGSFYIDQCFDQEQLYQQMLLDAQTKYSNLDTFLGLNSLFDGDKVCETLSVNQNLNYARCLEVLNGIMVNGFTQTLFHLLKNLQSTMLIYTDTKQTKSVSEQISTVRSLLMRPQSNELVSLHQIYIKEGFKYMRKESLKIIQGFFDKMNGYYNMIFGVFVGLLTIFQIVVYMYLVNRLSIQIIKMYHVVLLIPFSGRTQNDLNRLMMLKL